MELCMWVNLGKKQLMDTARFELALQAHKTRLLDQAIRRVHLGIRTQVHRVKSPDLYH